EEIEDRLLVIGRIDDDGLTGLAVPDDVDEVDHLLGDPVVLREIEPRQQLLEIEARRFHTGEARRSTHILEGGNRPPVLPKKTLAFTDSEPAPDPPPGPVHRSGSDHRSWRIRRSSSDRPVEGRR